ncbi:MAG: excisionase family DNA-binding protein [Vicinamibacterales bacterium]|nr:excisionase family DNA-binding protein [Vicinamibacterales bacterium]
MFTTSTHPDSPAFEPQLGRSVSIDRAAELLNVSRRTIYNRIRDGRLQTIRTRCGSQRVVVESMHGAGFRPQPFSTTPTAAVLDVRPVRS